MVELGPSDESAWSSCLCRMAAADPRSVCKPYHSPIHRHTLYTERERERDIYIYTRTVCDASSHDVDDKVVQRSKAPNAHLLNVRAGPLEDWLGMR